LLVTLEKDIANIILKQWCGFFKRDKKATPDSPVWLGGFALRPYRLCIAKFVLF